MAAAINVANAATRIPSRMPTENASWTASRASSRIDVSGRTRSSASATEACASATTAGGAPISFNRTRTPLRYDAAKTDPMIATPSAVPICRVASFIADPTPALLPRAKLLIQRDELRIFEHLHPLQDYWYVADALRGIPADRIVTLDGDYALGAGFAIVKTPGHTAGNHTLVVNTDRGLWTISENGIAVECYAPEASEIAGGLQRVVSANELPPLRAPKRHRHANEGHVRRQLRCPFRNERMQMIAMRAAVGEELENLDLPLCLLRLRCRELRVIAALDRRGVNRRGEHDRGSGGCERHSQPGNASHVQDTPI